MVPSAQSRLRKEKREQTIMFVLILHRSSPLVIEELPATGTVDRTSAAFGSSAAAKTSSESAARAVTAMGSSGAGAGLGW